MRQQVDQAPPFHPRYSVYLLCWEKSTNTDAPPSPRKAHLSLHRTQGKKKEERSAFLERERARESERARVRESRGGAGRERRRAFVLSDSEDSEEEGTCKRGFRV